ncbi:hypothetical protein MES5069_270214 [Mesorhizobium escarrei]|uniref:Uncharacterized protein n=1 Tax=Mesorhizobium escarrei TaxID=666018 RepID=A0ABN8JSD5_9HYPH|nr:hypothetical protein MES5069_270214 [Mesorhizobium escarrei]
MRTTVHLSIEVQRLMVGEIMMQHLTKVPLVERLATNGAELEMLCFVLRRRPVALALDPGCGVVGSIPAHVGLYRAYSDRGRPDSHLGGDYRAAGPSQRGGRFVSPAGANYMPLHASLLI